MDAELHISTDEEVVGPVSDFTYSWCLNCGMPGADARRFTVAVSELITDIILFAYPTDGKAFFDITFWHTLSNVEIVISEVGEPFDPDRHRYNPVKAVKEGDFEGAGFRLIRRFCDEFLFINKGKEGKEFHLTKSIAVHDIDEKLEQSRVEKPIEPDVEEVEKPGLLAEDFKYSQITPADAEDIAKLIYRTYGYTYSKEDLYFPKKIAKTLLGKEKLGIIVRNDEGLAVGYFAVLKKQDSNIGEVGEAVVSSSYRKRGIMSKMMEHLISIAREHKLSGIFGKAVTLHPVSQKVNHKFGFKTTALLMTDSIKVKFKGFHEDYPQPISVVVDFLPLIKKSNKIVYLPEKYRDIILETYEELGISVTLQEPLTPKMSEKSDISLNINYTDASALLVVRKYGPDFRSVFGDMLKSLEEQEDLNTIYLDLPLENSATPTQYQTIKDFGFIYSGLVPLFHEEADFLRLQKVFYPMDLDLIEAYSEFGKKIKSIVEDEYDQHT